MNFSLGSDPEFMLVKNGKYYSATGVVAGTKERRILSEGHEYYYDNVMAECAIRPGRTKEEAVDNFRNCFLIFAKMVHPYRLTAQASQFYTHDQLVHKDAREVGCEAEFCAYKMDYADAAAAVHAIKKTNFRSAGGHIHLGSTDRVLQDGYYQLFVTRMLDLFVGLPLIFIDKDTTAPARRRIYGKAGRHRRPIHGLEYRTPGNYWLTSPKLVGLVHDLCAFVLSFVEQNRHFEMWNKDHSCFGYNLSELRFCIDESNQKVGAKYMELASAFWPPSLSEAVESAIGQKRNDMYKEWGL